MYCPKCGNEVNDGDIFCKSCGEQIKKDNAPLFELKAKKNGVQAILLYLSFVIIHILILSIIAMIAITIMKSNGTYYGPVAFKASCKQWGLVFNPLGCLIISLIIMKVKNLFKSKKAYIMLAVGMIMAFLFSAVAGFIFPAIMTRYKAEKTVTAASN